MPTISKEISISGKGLMSGVECSVKILPSTERGIRFYPQGSSIPVIAACENVVSTDNCVVLGNAQGAKVVLVEHFMAACAFAGVDSLDVYLGSFEMPILDGSAASWHELLGPISANIKETLFEKPLITPNIMLFPADRTKITYCINMDHPELANRWFSFDISRDNKHEIMESRTFGYLRDLDKFRQMGMALGVTPENTVGLTETGYTTELRSGLEPVKHKILDLIGDLYLTGLNPLGFRAHIIAMEAGHRIHVEFAGALSDCIYS